MLLSSKIAAVAETMRDMTLCAQPLSAKTIRDLAHLLRSYADDVADMEPPPARILPENVVRLDGRRRHPPLGGGDAA